MKYGLYLNEVLMEKFETEREAYKAADFANSETGVTHYVRFLGDTDKRNELKRGNNVMNELVEYVLEKSMKIVEGRIVYDSQAIEALNSAGVSVTFNEQGVKWTLN